MNASYDNAGQISETAKCPSGTSENFKETATGWSWDCVGGINPTRVSCIATRRADVQPVCGTQVGGTNCTCASGTANGCTLSGCLSGRWTGTNGQYGREWDCIGPNAYRGPTVRCFTPLPGQEPYSCPTSTSTGSDSGSGGGGTTGTTSGSCGTANGATLTCGDLMSCLGGKTICASGTSSPISGTEPSGANALALHNPTTSSTWVGWDWTCGGSSKCLACLPGYVQSGGTCVPQGQTGGGTTSGSCGTAYGQDFTSQPTSGLCASGTPSAITYHATCASPGGPGGRCANWAWTCGSSQFLCSAWDVRNLNSGTGTGGAIQIPGYCGNAATNYTNDQTQYSGSFCYTGIQEPLNPAFPSQNGSSQWTCKGLTGGTDSSTCTATRNSTLPQTCSTYTASTTIPVGYGSPFNQLSGSKESLLSIACSSTASGATANAGSTQSDTYTYKTGFVSQNGTWSKIDFSGNPDPNNAGWFKGVATASLPAASSSQNFVAAFICQYNGGKWKCGCRDSACSQNYWTLQAYQK